MKRRTTRQYLKNTLTRFKNVSAQAVLATIAASATQAATVKNFGAIGDGSANDTAAIQKAINATPRGAVLRFPAGTYRVTRTLKLKAGVTYQGVGNSILKGYQGTGAGGYLIADGGGASNVTISGMVFDGGGVNFSQDGWTRNINITNNTFQNITNKGQWFGVHCGILLNGVRQINISNNKFYMIMDGGAPTLTYWTTPRGQALGILMYRVSHLLIAGNTFDNMSEGIHWAEGEYIVDMRDVRILHNLFTRIYGMAIELQGGSAKHPITGLVIDHNVGYKWLKPHPETFGVSLAAYSKGARMTNNFWDASTDTPTGKTFGMCFEVDGDSTLVEGNTCVASNNPVGWGTTNGNAIVAGINAVIRNNVFCGGPQTIGTETKWATYRAYNNRFPACGPVIAPPDARGRQHKEPLSHNSPLDACGICGARSRNIEVIPMPSLALDHPLPDSPQRKGPRPIASPRLTRTVGCHRQVCEESCQTEREGSSSKAVPDRRIYSTIMQQVESVLPTSVFLPSRQ